MTPVAATAGFQMPIEDYLAEIRHAVEGLIPLIWEEADTARELREEVERLKRAAREGYRRAEALGLDAQDSEDVAWAAGAQWETYFGADKERHQAAQTLESVEQRTAAHAFSVAALAGALLQHGKQGISIVHGGLAGAPNGRMIGSQPLKEVIWQGRNQGLHWEEQSFHSPVEGCFHVLAADIDPKFADYTTRNMAFDIVELLGWRDFNSFAADLRLLA
jgi:hypothetical protein